MGILRRLAGPEPITKIKLILVLNRQRELTLGLLNPLCALVALPPSPCLYFPGMQILIGLMNPMELDLDPWRDLVISTTFLEALSA
jgi:hypothetical protein